MNLDGFNNNNNYFKIGFLINPWNSYISVRNISVLQMNIKAMNEKYNIFFLYNFKQFVVFI